jgi:O-antigen/teichoic acid export membrane protein
MAETETLRQKTISGMLWSFSDSVAGQGIQFVVGLILARILSPAEFGLIGMITVFLAVSQSFIDSGFGQALIRKPKAGQSDFSTVFWFNIFAGVLFFLLFFLLAPAIARFYDEPQLQPLTRVLSIILIINSFGLVQRAILTRKIDFRLQTKITIISAVISGIVAVYMALSGYGVWSLVWKSLLGYLIQTILFWMLSGWHPEMTFSKESFRDLFGFGSKLLLSGLIDTAYRNIYPLIIGKFFTAQELGFYSRAEQFTKLPSQNISQIVQRVSYPALSMVQDNTSKLKSGYRQVISSTMYISFLAMLGLAAVAKPMVILLIGEKWLPSVPYLQLLCLGGMLYPLHAINLNMLKVKGRSDLFLRLEIIKKLLAIPVILAGIFVSINAMLTGMVIHSFAAYFINSYYSGKLVDYPFREQIGDIYASFFIALCVSLLVWSLSYILPFSNIIILMLQLTVGIGAVLLMSETIQPAGYPEIKAIVKEKISEFRSRRK